MDKSDKNNLPKALERLEGNEAFSVLLNNLKQMYIFDASVSANGEQALRKEGAREVVLNILNLVEEQKHNDD